MIVSIQDLRFHYHHSGPELLDIPQWQLQSAEQVFLHGPSGSGKSTLLNLLAGILLPSSGNIEILGKRVNRLSGRQRDKWRAQHIGVVFQQFNLIPYLSAVDNIRLAAYFADSDDAGRRAGELLTALGIDRSLHHQSAGQLSIGQQQRVAIARALINEPELLIVDEPTSALDEHNRQAFMGLLMDQLAQHRTALIFVSHDMSLAESFSRVEQLGEINRAGGLN